MNLFDLSDDVAVVIGATGVLGGALAEGLAAAGAKVAVLGRNAERGQARVQNIRKQGGQAEFFAADAIRKEDLREAHQAVEKSLARRPCWSTRPEATIPKSP
jgi:NAD(P)-dependent dehydrogenase (short-subunit alcohol dehydrogenase family)